MELCELEEDELKPRMLVELMEHQQEALASLSNGNILYGGVGSGKSITALAYYWERERPRDIYIITTAKKRDSLDWDGEAAKFGISRERAFTLGGTLTVDSWNNIGAYVGIQGAFFIFDEQRVVGHGVWVKSFIKIAKKNHWILLSATPGDTWLDYAPVFIANGWYKNITDFKRQHVVYAPFVRYPRVARYLGEEKLERLRTQILVEMPYEKHTTRILNFLDVGYDQELWDTVVKKRWNPYSDRPIMDVAELFRLMRRVVNSDPSRLEMLRELAKIHPKLIVFYNFDYELEILRSLAGEFSLAEWNGHKHEPIPDTDRWIYLVQYNSGAESWECIDTNAMVLYSLTYSYKNYVQSQGRIDRINTPYTDLYYYVFVTSSLICKSVRKALSEKKSFNERDLLKSGEYLY